MMMTVILILAIQTQQLHCSNLFNYLTTAHTIKTTQKEQKKSSSLWNIANLLSPLIDFKAKLKTITSCEILTHFYYIPRDYL